MFVGQIDLRWFYPLWAVVGLLSLIAFPKGRSNQSEISRTVHSPLDDFASRDCRCFALCHRATAGAAQRLGSKFPFASCPKDSTHSSCYHRLDAIRTCHLNYPTGSHTLLAILSTMTGLPVHTIFKDFLPLLGVLTTGQICLLTRRVIGDSSAGLWGAFAYGMWADFGSINYSGWGGLPNEMGMLFFLAVLVTWLESASIPLMAIFHAALVLTHHHVMLTAAAILAIALIWPGRIVRRPLLLAGFAAAFLDSFFLIPYATHISTLWLPRTSCIPASRRCR